MAAKTIEVNILQERKGKALVKVREEYKLVDKNNPLAKEGKSVAGMPFQGAACGAGENLLDEDGENFEAEEEESDGEDEEDDEE
jgi:hypothetical protein